MKRRKKTEFIIPDEIAISEEFSFGVYGMLVRDPFSEIPKTSNESLYFKDEAWMKYHKCPLCGKYVLKEPELIKMPRGSVRTHKVIRWNVVLLHVIFDKRTTPCIKCVSDLTRRLIIDHNRDRNTALNEEVNLWI